MLCLMGLTLLLSGCGGSNEPAQDNTSTSGNTQEQTQLSQQSTANYKSPDQGWSLHMTAKKLFPGNPDMTVNMYCKSVVGNMTECQIYDSSDNDARLVGMEVIVGPEMYNTFLSEEKKLWLPSKDQMQLISANMPDLSSDQFTNFTQSLSGSYSKVYLLWDPGKLNLPTGNPQVTIISNTVSSGTPQSNNTAGNPSQPVSTAGSSSSGNGGFTFGAFDIAKLVSAGLEQKKSNFESSVLQRNSVGSIELYKLKDRIGLHQYSNTTHVMFIVSGKGEFTIGDKKQEVSGGMVVIIPNGTPHAFKNLGGKDQPLIFVTFKTPYDENGVKWLE